MKLENYFYNCSKEYVVSINQGMYQEINDVIHELRKRTTQAEVNQDLFLHLIEKGWSYDTIPGGLTQKINDKNQTISSMDNNEINEIKKRNKRPLCLTSTTLNVRWHSDFAKIFTQKLVQIEAQFGKTESMFKDFCGFKIANFEKRLALGIEIVIYEPNKYFSHRKKDISGMANFNIAKETLLAINLNCPIWLIGIKD